MALTSGANRFAGSVRPRALGGFHARVLLNKCLVEPYSDVRFCQVFSASKTGLSVRTGLRTWAMRTWVLLLRALLQQAVSVETCLET